LHQTLLGEALGNSPMLAFVADEDMRYIALSKGAWRLWASRGLPGDVGDAQLQDLVAGVSREAMPVPRC
jgi:hypothetical protein